MKKYYAAINTWVLGGFDGSRDAFKCIDSAAEFGVDGVELTVGDVIPATADEAFCKKVREYAASKNIGIRTVATGASWNMRLSDPCDKKRGEAVEWTKNYLRIASWFGAEAALVIPGVVNAGWDASCPVTPAKTVWRQSTRSMWDLLDTAESLNVAVACENVWSKFLTDPFAMKAFVDQFDSPFIGAYLDVANCLNVGYPQDWVEVLGKRIKGIHFKNWKSEDFGGGLHGFGDDITVGEADFPAILAAMDRVGYTGPVTLEMIPFSRLPDMVLPDLELAEKTAKQLLQVLS